MKNRTKYLLIGTALLAATAGSVMAFGGPGNCNQVNGGMFGNGPYGHMQGQTQGRMGYMRGIRQLDNLTAEQIQQLSELRQTQQEFMSGKRAEMATRHAAMKAKVDAILTEEQRDTLTNRGPSGFGYYGPRGRFGG